MRTSRTAGSSHRVRGRLAAAGVVACVTALGVAPAALGAGGRESASKTITLNGKQTKTVTVGYPHALEFPGAKYTCGWRFIGHVVDPKKIKVTRQSSLGGTVCSFKFHNPAAPSLDASAVIRVTATTISGGLG
jgi:hypothetical protein